MLSTPSSLLISRRGWEGWEGHPLAARPILAKLSRLLGGLQFALSSIEASMFEPRCHEHNAASGGRFWALGP